MEARPSLLVAGHVARPKSAARNQLKRIGNLAKNAKAVAPSKSASALPSFGVLSSNIFDTDLIILQKELALAEIETASVESAVTKVSAKALAAEADKARLLQSQLASLKFELAKARGNAKVEKAETSSAATTAVAAEAERARVLQIEVAKLKEELKTAQAEAKASKAALLNQSAQTIRDATHETRMAALREEVKSVTDAKELAQAECAAAQEAARTARAEAKAANERASSNQGASNQATATTGRANDDELAALHAKIREAMEDKVVAEAACAKAQSECAKARTEAIELKKAVTAATQIQQTTMGQLQFAKGEIARIERTAGRDARRQGWEMGNG